MSLDRYIFSADFECSTFLQLTHFVSISRYIGDNLNQTTHVYAQQN